MVEARKLPTTHPAYQHLNSTKALLEILQQQPKLILQYEDFGFIRRYLRELGVNIPEPGPITEATSQEQSTASMETEYVEEPRGDSEKGTGEEEEEVNMEGTDEQVEEEEEEEIPDSEVIEDKEDESTFPEIGGATPDDAEVDYDKLGQLKMDAADATAASDFKKAIELYTQAVKMQPSGLTYAKRAECLLKENRLNATIRDCTLALEQNPDNAKAMKTRGKAYRYLGRWEEAAQDLRKGLVIDFDEASEEMRREVEKHVQLIEQRKTKQRAKERMEKEREIKRRIKERQEAQERAKAERAKSSSAGMPNMGGFPGAGGFSGAGEMPPGMEGLMASLLSDPELAQGLQNPKIMSALQASMSDPSKMMEYMRDPEVASFYQKLMSKVGGGSGAGMGGGPFGGTGSGFGGGAPGFGGGNANMGGMGPDADEVD